jgi:hypothetical protein
VTKRATIRTGDRVRLTEKFNILWMPENFTQEAGTCTFNSCHVIYVFDDEVVYTVVSTFTARNHRGYSTYRAVCLLLPNGSTWCAYHDHVRKV